MPDADYFSAVDDEAAIAVIEAGGPAEVGLDVIHLKAVDPVVVIAKLEAVLTGRSYDEASRGPGSGRLLSCPDAEGPFVLTVSDTLFDALVSATPNEIARAAQAWSATDELRLSGVDAATATTIVQALAGLAARARADALRLYCWWTL